VAIAKNYLGESELEGLNRIVTMYLDYAEMQAQKGIAMHMKDWVNKLDAFLQFNEAALLVMKLRLHLLKMSLKNIESFKMRLLFLILMK
jgi:hypothetical protein